MPERVSAKNSANFGHIKLAVFKKINLRGFTCLLPLHAQHEQGANIG
jgi:hypothetical protein